jgi:hypothetical protein
MKATNLRQFIATCFAAGLFALGNGAAFAKGDPFAYMIAGNSDFGVIDLKTGVFTLCGNSGVLQAGLGLGPDGTIYGGAWKGTTISTVNPSNGTLTTIGNTSFQIWAFGSTSKGRLWAMDMPGNLYSINPATGAGTLVGPTGVAFNQSETYGVSAASSKFYVSNGTNFYSVSAKNGKTKTVGPESSTFGAFVSIKGVLYGGGDTSPFSVYTVNTTNGSDTLVAPLTGEADDFWGLVPTPKGATGTCPR